MPIRAAINGFGRIGKNLLRISLEQKRDIEIVAINSTSGPEKHAHLFKYDSIYGTYPGEIKVDGNNLIVDGKKIIFTAERDPEKLPWDELDIDIVFESTGVFRKNRESFKHLEAGADRVIITAPSNDAEATIVMGVNQNVYSPSYRVVSCASCTTNCLAPIVKVLHDNFGIINGSLTTVHSYTSDQNLTDKPHKKDLRRGRAANLSIIPTTTGAAKAIGKVIPELKGKLNGGAVRVPTPTVSMIDFVANLKTDVTAEEINRAFSSAASGELAGVLDYTEEPLVSSDFIKNQASSIVDGLSTMVIDGNVAKVFAWYDNEYGYACRVLDMAEYIYRVSKNREKEYCLAGR